MTRTTRRLTGAAGRLLSACFQERNAGREEVRIPQEGEDTTEDDDANAGREAQVGKSGERLEQEFG